TGGSRGDFVAPDPSKSGDLLLTQSDSIMRLSGIPSPGGAAMGAVVGVVAARRRRRAGGGGGWRANGLGPSRDGARLCALRDTRRSSAPGAGTNQRVLPVAGRLTAAAPPWCLRHDHFFDGPPWSWRHIGAEAEAEEDLGGVVAAEELGQARAEIFD